MPTSKKPGIRALFFADGSHSKTPISVLFFNSILLTLFLTGCLYISIKSSDLHWDWFSIYEYKTLFLDGWKTTILICLCSLCTSTLIGVSLAIGKNCTFLPLQLFAKGYIECIRGTPLLAQIYIFFYIIAENINLNNRYIAGTLALSLFSGAYIAEIIRSGLESIGRSQLESAKAIGLSRAQIYRYIVIPQATRAILPPLSGQFISLIKDSSLLSIIGLNELTQNAKNVASYTFSNFESYIILAIGYLALTLPLSLWTRWLEKKVRYET